MLIRFLHRFLRSAFAVALVHAACGGNAVRDFPSSGTGGASGTGGGAGDAGVSKNTGTCEPYCATNGDCCSDCRYPNNLICRDRHCVSLGCTGNDDCARVHHPGVFCWLVRGVPSCIEPCRVDADCGDAEPICVGRDDRGETYCGRLPVLLVPCFSDSDCDGKGVCDLTTFSCGCSRDDQCPVGSVCIE